MTVVACFTGVFVVTLLLAGRQYFLVRAREVENRLHQLELHAQALDTGIQTVKSQLRFLRISAERLLPAQSGDVDPLADPALNAALQAQQAPLWHLDTPTPGAAIRGIGSQQLAQLPGLGRDDGKLAKDLKLARIMGQLLSVQLQLNGALSHTAMVTSSGVVVSDPPLDEGQDRRLVELLAASKMLRLAARHPDDFDVLFDAEYGRRSAVGNLLLFAAPVALAGQVRAAIVFAIPQKTLQDRLHQAARSNSTYALLDLNGVLIASNEATFDVVQESWLSTLPTPWNSFPVTEFFASRTGRSSSGEDFLLYRKLDHASLALVSYVPARVMVASILHQFSVLFIGIWLLLAFLLVTTLVVVDRLLAGQMKLSQQLREIAVADPLTGLANRRRLDEEFARLVQDRQGQLRVSVLMVDIDHFKQVNDVWGHEAGDDVLKRLTTLITGVTRPHDIVARFGGEEFCILLDSGVEEARALSERMRVTIAESSCPVRQERLSYPVPIGEIRVTVSIGIANSVVDDCQNPEELIAVADRRLYLAKQSGRNRVVSTGR